MKNKINMIAQKKVNDSLITDPNGGLWTVRPRIQTNFIFNLNVFILIGG